MNVLSAARWAFTKIQKGHYWIELASEDWHSSHTVYAVFTSGRLVQYIHNKLHRREDS